MNETKKPETTPDDHYDDDDDHDPEEELMDECMLGRDGQCGLAGSEFCDFSCPMRDSEFFAGSKAWKQKKRDGK